MASMRDEKTMHVQEEWLRPAVEASGSTLYRLCHEVASGGMASVYLARYEGSVGFERVVALKTIHEHLAKQPHFVEMFLDEARIAAHVAHPYVCQIFDFGAARGSYFIAMEFVNGESLAEIWEALRERPDIAEAPSLPLLIARIVADLAEGLHAAHELREGDAFLNLVHRDVSPSNLFVAHDGTVRIVDFGIATAQNKIHQTETGTVKGKFAYMSPEQLAMKDLDRRSDVWSLGVVLWELLTGERLFRRDAPMDTIRAVTEGRIVPPSEAHPGLPAALDEIVLRCLDRERETRFASARELSLALERFLSAQKRSVPKAQVSSWLEDLFPGAAEGRRHRVEATRRGEGELTGEAAILETGRAGRRPSTDSLPTALPIDDRTELSRPPLAAWEAVAAEMDPARRSLQESADREAGGAASGRASAGRSSVSPLLPAALGALLVIGAAAAWIRPWEHAGPPADAGRDVSAASAVSPDLGPRPSAPPRTARLRLNASAGWAEIRIEGQLRGRTPLELELEPGRREILFIPYGDASEQRLVVELEAGEERQLSLEISPRE